MTLLGFLHERRRTQVTLLASGCLEGAERARAERHLEACAECRREHAGILQLLAAVASDPLRSAEPPVPVEFLVTRVEARLGRGVRAHAWRWAWLAAGIGIGLLAAPLASRLAERARGTPPGAARAEATVSMDDEALRRLARVLAREQAVRYLLEAEDLLLNVKADARPCPEGHSHVELAAEAERSRELLARRALLLDLEADALLPARDVLQDVDHILREIASLRRCSGREELDRVRREMEERRLLMKVRLLSRELVS